MVNKIVALDIDGVLNCDTTKARSPGGYIGVSDKLIKRLKKIVDDTGAKIVLSSDWRIDREESDDFRYLKNKLYYKGNLTIFDYTPDISWNKRGTEIRIWLEKNKVDNFVVLDDIDFADFHIGDFMNHVILTDATIGLSNKDVEKAISILNKGGD